jgi:hypothetical protein
MDSNLGVGILHVLHGDTVVLLCFHGKLSVLSEPCEWARNPVC